MTDEIATYISVTLVLLGMIGCEVIRDRRATDIQLRAIEKGYCKDNWGNWLPCATLPKPAEKPQ